MKNTKCQCITCKGYRIIKKYIPDKDREIIDKMLNQLLNDAMDGAYYNAIMRGDWPNSEQILQEALKQVKKKNNDRTRKII